MKEERLPQKMLEWCPPGRRRKDLETHGCRSNNWNQKEGNEQHGMDQQGRMEKENKTLGTERSENINTLYINKKLAIIIRHTKTSIENRILRQIFGP